MKFGFLIVLSEKSITFFKQENVYGQIDLGFELKWQKLLGYVGYVG